MTAGDILVDVPRVLVAIMVCALTPLALRSVALPRLAKTAAATGAVAAVPILTTVGGEPGWVWLVAPYAVVAGIAGLVGIHRLLARPWPPSQLAQHVALIVLAGASVWLVSYQAGYALLGYPPFWVLLTAAHFHVAGCFLAIAVGWAAHGRGRFAELVTLGCILGVPLTAIGIAWSHALEVVAGVVMAASGFGAAIVIATHASELPRWRRTLLRLATLPLALGMVLAALYALRDHGTALALGDLDPLSSMIISHGVLDTLFAALALTAIFGAPRITALPPLSRLRGAFPVGATFFARRELERAPAVPPRGLVDQLAHLGHTELDAERVAPAIRTFYEQTAAHDMIVRPSWRTGFRTGARLWAALARRMGQLQLPVSAESGREGITSRIVALAADADGRTAPRAWIRTFPDGRALYVAAYSTHRVADRAYMNIAFPLPGGQLSSVLRMDHHGAGVRVSTRLGGDCGIWVVLLGQPIRLPLSETIDVWTADDPAAPAALRTWAAGYSTIARHDLWLCGVHYLTLEYAMRPRADSAAGQTSTRP